MAGTKSSGGRNAKSRTTHLVQGTFRQHRHDKLATPALPKGKPIPPKALSAVARAEWRRMVARLEQLQTGSRVDDAALYQYVCLFAETEGILGSKRDNALLIKTLLATIHALVEAAATDRDGVQERVVDIESAVAQIVELKKLEAKHTTQQRQGHMAIRQYLVEFGMTPAARTRVTAQPDEAHTVPNPLDQFTKARA